MRAPARIALAVLAALILCAPASAGAQFGIHDASVSFTDEDGAPLTDAGRHPYEMKVDFRSNTALDPRFGLEVPEGSFKDLFVTQIPGLAGNPSAAALCSSLEFLGGEDGGEPECPRSSYVGEALVHYIDPTFTESSFVYNLRPSPGKAARIGLEVAGVRVTIDVEAAPTPPYSLIARSANISNVVFFYGIELTLWGVPADSGHDEARGGPGGSAVPFLTMPRACKGPLFTRFEGFSWEGASFGEDVPSGELGNCIAVGFSVSEAELGPSTARAASPSGLRFLLRIDDEGIDNPTGTAASDIKKTVVTLPEGMTLNPSLAEGLAACSPADFERESAAAPWRGCPGASKVGTVEATTPLLEGRALRGSLYVATPNENPFDSLIALYMVIREPELGLFFKLSGRVDPDPASGQIVTSFDELPPYPLEEVEISLREGGRSPLISPRRCGSYESEAAFTPYAHPGDPVAVRSSFEITQGPGGGPCPAAPSPFEPGFSAGALNNQAGAFSPFLLGLTRRDGDQDLVRFDATLPPGALAKLAGVQRCPEEAIAALRARSGREELASPSCPPGSRIGSVDAGAGAGSQLTYVKGAVYLAGPFAGAPLSVLAVVPAVAGPFDVGTVVTRQALDLDPITAQARVDGARSDPIPHILAGIPLSVRDVRVRIDRENFTLNPTGCREKQVRAEIWGGGADPFGLADDAPVARAERFQAANCARLGFGPRLGLFLKGGTRRGAHPALRAVVRPRPGEANFSRAVVTLPRSAFLDQAHIRTICTRVQFASGAGHGAGCPPGARYGWARAWSPLLDEPAQGPIYLRSSDNNLPDLVVALRGPASAPVDVELSARIDSLRGGIRSTFAAIPDVPVSRFELNMQGGEKGLIVNSRHLCFKPKRNRARANLRGQNGRFSRTRPRVVAVRCQKRRKSRRAQAKRSAGHVSWASAVGSER